MVFWMELGWCLGWSWDGAWMEIWMEFGMEFACSGREGIEDVRMSRCRASAYLTLPFTLPLPYLTSPHLDQSTTALS